MRGRWEMGEEESSYTKETQVSYETFSELSNDFENYGHQKEI